jgi:hypothetical protein
MSSSKLPLNNIAARHKGLTKSIAESYCEAARVCLDRHHTSPKKFVLNDDALEKFTIVEWEATDDQCKKAWANKDDATRDGAYAVAIAATELSRGLFAVKRAETLTGADYYIAPFGKDIEDLEDCLRLEVSGTDSNEYEVKKRLIKKVKQALSGKSNLPALAAVVGFKAEIILIKTVEEDS